MAVNPQIEIEIRQPALSRSLIQLPDDLTVIPAGIIQGPGVVPSRQDPKVINLYLRASASDITGYNDLLLTEAGSPIQYVSAAFSRFQNKLIKEFATRAGLLDGVDCQTSTVNVYIGARCYKAGMPETDATEQMAIRMYHRDTSGTETSIAYAKPTITGKAMTTYTWSPTVTQSWTTNERIVIKFWGHGANAMNPS